MVTDFIAWDDAVKVAVDFADANGETLVLALPDHNTGGIKVGNFNHNYLDRTVEFARDPLLGMKMSSNGVVRDLDPSPTPEDLKAAVSEHWSIDLTDEDVNRILNYNDLYAAKYLSNPVRVGPENTPAVPLNYALSRIVSEEYTIAGWTSHGHNGEDGEFISSYDLLLCDHTV